MHELSIAQEIINIVKSSLPENYSRVKSVKLKVGKLSGILIDSLEFCFESIVTQTELDGAKLEVEEIPITIKCIDCNAESILDEPIFQCPKCQSFNVQLVTGKELSISEIEIED